MIESFIVLKSSGLPACQVKATEMGMMGDDALIGAFLSAIDTFSRNVGVGQLSKLEFQQKKIFLKKENVNDVTIVVISSIGTPDDIATETIQEISREFIDFYPSNESVPDIIDATNAGAFLNKIVGLINLYNVRIEERNKQYKIQLLLNRMMIGLGAGLVFSQKVMLKDDIDPQGAMDILARWIGQEIGKELMEQNKVSENGDKFKIIEEFLNEFRLAEDIVIDIENEVVSLSMKKCFVCADEDTGYDLEGKSVCPVGGLIQGIYRVISGNAPQISGIKLERGDNCQLNFDFSTKENGS